MIWYDTLYYNIMHINMVDQKIFIWLFSRFSPKQTNILHGTRFYALILILLHHRDYQKCMLHISNIPYRTFQIFNREWPNKPPIIIVKLYHSHNHTIIKLFDMQICLYIQRNHMQTSSGRVIRVAVLKNLR